jgi:hypothetical protein
MSIARTVAGVTYAVLMCFLGFVPSASGQTDDHASISGEEYRVFNVVLSVMKLPKDDPHVVIENVTLNFRCGAESNNPTLANGCSFLALTPATSGDVGELLTEKWPSMAKSTWADFQQKNGASAVLKDSFVTPWKHRLVGPDIPDDGSKEWHSPDIALIVSRVGFNAQKDEAVVYFLVFSYMEQVETGGDYFLLKLDDSKQWALKGRVRYFHFDKDQPAER